MSKQDLLLEIGLEEMPARFVTDSMNQLSDKVKAWLVEKGIQFAGMKAYSTPRRLAVLVEDVEEAQEDVHEEAKGPAKKIALNDQGEWTKAAIGFSRGQGATPDDIFFKEIKGVEYAHVKTFTKGQETLKLLPELKELILSMHFPKNMKWADKEMRFIRPIKWLVAMFGEKVVPFEITDVQTGNTSRGHRFLGKDVIITNPKSYEKALLAEYVIVDAVERKEAIRKQIDKLEEEQNWLVPIDEDLLEEVNNLVEYPTALFGSFEEEYLSLPEEVLVTSMKEHQRYFPVKSKSGDLLPQFITVRNGGHEHLDNVARGNEKVLRARLSDAAFFYNEDQKTSIETSLKKLEKIVYHEEIGTMSEKVGRVRALTNHIAQLLSLSSEDKKVADRAAEICKFDLVTQMVYEFPELQGFMGEKYALQKGEDAVVAQAINEHYMPRNAHDSTAKSVPGAILSIAEKLDTIVSCFAIGIIPSGSQDPYALRRQATGIVQTLLNMNWEISFEELINQAIHLTENAGINKQKNEKIKEELIAFFRLRIKYILQEKAIRYDLIDAVLGSALTSVPAIIERAKVLHSNKDNDSFKGEIEALSRVLNIAQKAESMEDVQIELFENEDEHKLYNKYIEVRNNLDETTNAEVYFNYLISLKPEIDMYFEHTMVMAEDPKVKANRLSFMAHLATMIQSFAQMNHILVK
ncbi:glycine--tRNA ligase subunit beta [Cytobacillus sp. FSL R5-0569]|uniref:glycine--tRNA ligase subunit beta n=1 Tax=Cytobacillus TaxID=2675230 RepID=UPI00278293A6|nr:glycine--tRNA ligase subunit beta [Cytobacillus kochii]MDQ0183692.1 glycyl-tRNA synthetase beta chain [Cytobacillus kochii]